MTGECRTPKTFMDILYSLLVLAFLVLGYYRVWHYGGLEAVAWCGVSLLAWGRFRDLLREF